MSANEASAGTAKRQLIMNSAIGVFAENGYHKSRVADIARRAGVAHGLFYHYFASKEDVLMCIFRGAWMNLLAYMDAPRKGNDDPVAGLVRVIRYMVKNFFVNAELMKVLVMDVPQSPGFYGKENQRLYRRFFTSMEKMVAEGKKRNLIRRDVAPAFASHMVHGAIDSIIRTHVYTSGARIKKAGMEGIVNKVTRMLLYGICT